jgi:succinate dehydrogenase / fumarate reductase cytochrome b subunit
MATATRTVDEEIPARSSRAAVLWHSWVGKKALMAVTGFVLFAYVLVHMLGNLQAFLGAAALDAYAAKLRVFPTLLWAARIVLLASVIVHVIAGVQLWLARHRAREVGYREYRPADSTLASRTMIWSGFLILGFVVYHLLDLTFGVANPNFREGQVFHNLVVSLGRGAAAVFYVAAVAGLGFHLWHGLWSAFQSIGLSSRVFTPTIRRLAAAFGTLLAVGFSAVPLAILLGILR